MKLSIISACTVFAVKAAVVEGFLGGGYRRVSLTNNEVVLVSLYGSSSSLITIIQF